MAIKKQEIDTRRKVLDNPIKMKKLKEYVSAVYQVNLKNLHLDFLSNKSLSDFIHISPNFPKTADRRTLENLP